MSSTADTGSVLIANAPGLRVVDLNRPKALNALNAEMVDTLLPLVRDWQQLDGDVKMVVFRGVGGRAFCAGGDIRFLHECASGDEERRAAAHRFFNEEYSLNHALGTSRVPVVSLLDGIVMGGGVGLSVHGQFRIATESTLFAMPEVGIGFFPDVGGTFFLPRLRGALGNYLGLTGARLSGRDVHAAGVATHFVASERVPLLEGLLANYAQKALDKGGDIDQATMHSAIAALDHIDHFTQPAGSSPPEEAPASYLTVHAEEIDYCFSLPDVPAIMSAVNEMAEAATSAADDQHWSLRAAKELSKASPTSLAVTLEALQRGSELETLGECLQMEYRIAQRFMRSPDFLSGVAAVLSKERTAPEWGAAPATAAGVEEYFEAGAGGELELPSPISTGSNYSGGSFGAVK